MCAPAGATADNEGRLESPGMDRGPCRDVVCTVGVNNELLPGIPDAGPGVVGAVEADAAANPLVAGVCG